MRRLALSAAINRDQICRKIFSGARAPARDFTASSLPGFDPGIDGNLGPIGRRSDTQLERERGAAPPKVGGKAGRLATTNE